MSHFLAFCLCSGLALAAAQRFAHPVLGGAAVALASLAVTLGRRQVALLAAAVFAAGWWWGSARLVAIDRSPLEAEIGTSAPAFVEVTGPARLSSYSVRVPVRVRRLGERAVDEPAQLELPQQRAPPQGALLEVLVRVERPRGPRTSSFRRRFDEARYLRRRGVHVILRGTRYRVVGWRGGPMGLVDRIRARLAGSLAPGLEGERRAVIAGIVLGEDEGLDAELRARFRASGLYHLLAVSGQNVAYVVAGILMTAWLLGVPRWLAQVGALGAIACYVLAVGWQPSVVRAGIAGVLSSLAWLAARGRDRWYFLLVGAAVLLAWSPYNVLDPGFQLSFAAVAAIFLAVPRLQPWLEGYPLPRPLVSVVALSVACGLATAPILWLHFGAVPVLSVASNALAAPVVAPILGLGLFAGVVGLVSPEAALALGWANGWLAWYLAWCARLVGGLPFAQVGSPAVLLGLVGLVALGVLRRRLPPHRRRGALALLLLVALTLLVGWRLGPQPAPPPPPSGLRVSFLDVGQGDSVLLETTEGAVLVDQGPPEARVADRLRGLGVRRLSALVLTHPQRDHIGGAPEVLRSVEVDTVLDPRQPSESPYEKEALEAASARRTTVVTARAGATYRLGGLRLQLLWPDGPGSPGEDPNRRAIVLLASYGQTDVLLTADAESEVTGSLSLPEVEVLKVAHHGSADPGLAVLLGRLRPRVAVISVGADNEYGHPAPSTIAALLGRPDLRLFRTDRHGTVVLESDGSTLTARTER